ncbi:MAG: 2-phospho-L-lactate transferase CofD family protein, partial [Actinomycetota bacterium]|nr:2-phospho-L-lactate transferase CofD family protein [Actinomycetota bacterium]
LDRLKALGVDAWFGLGDRDLGTCMFRAARLTAGASLSEVTDEIRTRLGVAARVLPMSDDPVRTKIVSADGRTLDFQEYFVKERCDVEVAEIRLDGVADARPAPGVLDAIRAADRVVLCPSNPLLSIAPIVALAGIRDELARHPSVTAVTPIVRGAALKGPADRLLERLGHGSSASAVARMYVDFCDRFVVDARDPDEIGKVAALGLDALALDTVMDNDDDSERLARALLDG